MKISVVVFTLNEITGMMAIMPRIKKEWYDELIIIDGNSSDGTIEYAQEHGYAIYIQCEKGAGAAFTEAMQRITGDIVIPFSPDGNFIPEKIPLLLKKINEGYEIVTVSRYLPGAKSYDDDMVTAFGNRLFTGLINFLFRTKFTDSLYGYLAFKKNLIDRLKINKTSSWGPELLIKASKAGKKVGEIPGDEPVRMGGIRKMKPLPNGMAILKMIVKEFFNRKKYYVG